MFCCIFPWKLFYLNIKKQKHRKRAVCLKTPVVIVIFLNCHLHHLTWTLLTIIAKICLPNELCCVKHCWNSVRVFDCTAERAIIASDVTVCMIGQPNEWSLLVVIPNSSKMRKCLWNEMKQWGEHLATPSGLSSRPSWSRVTIYFE